MRRSDNQTSLSMKNQQGEVIFEDLDLGIVIIVIGLDTLVTYVILDLSVVIVIGLDTLMKHVYTCMVDHSKMRMFNLMSQVINGFIYLKRNVINIFNIEQVSRYLYQ